jgi:hypothetical protein
MTERDPIELTDEVPPAQLAALSHLLADGRVWEDPDPRVEDAVVAAITAEAAAAGPPTTGGVEVVITDEPAARRARAGARSRARRSGGGWGLLAGAAVAAILLVLVVVVAALRQSDEPSEGQFALQPAAGAPAGAGGSATAEDTPDGVRIKLRVDGLAPAGEDEYYELWLNEEGGGPEDVVSAGTFHLRGGGSEWIELWAGVSTDEYPLVSVTLEREGEGPGSSGHVLLTGRIP